MQRYATSGSSSPAATHVNPTPLPLASEGRAIKKLAFVDRDQEAYTIALANIRNKTNIDKPVLVTAGQLYGAGKTEMGRRAVERVRISKELQRKLAEEGKQTAADVEDYVRAASVTVDLSHYPPGSFNALEDYLAKALYDSICLSDHVPTGWPKTFPKWDLPLRGVVDLFVQLTGRSLFIHWDEVRASSCASLRRTSHTVTQVQVLQAAEFSLLTEKKLPAGFRSPSDPLQKGMAQYYAFWSVVAPLLVHPGVYTFATGKQTAFALLGLGVLHDRGLISPTRHKHLVLGALTAKDICETYEKTRLDDGKPLRDYFKTTNVELDEKLGEKIQAATAGHPRMVQLCLNALCQLEPDCLVMASEPEIDAALDRAYRIVAGQGRADINAQLLGSPHARSGELSGVYSMLLVAALLRQELPVGQNVDVELDNGREVPLLEAVNRLDVYLDSKDCMPGFAHVGFPQWALKRLREDSSRLDQRIQPILPLWSVPADVLGKGEPLEYIVRIRLLYKLRLAFGRRWAEVFPVFRDTVLADAKIALRDGHPGTVCIPAVSTRRKEKPEFAALRAAPWSSQIRPEDWKELFTSGVFPAATIGYPAPESYGPDVVVRCCANDAGAAKPERLAAAMMCKLGKTAIGATDLAEELDKAQPLLAACDQL